MTEMTSPPHNAEPVMPRIIERSRGGWLVVSAADEPIKIGVTGDTELDAVVRYFDALQSWKELLAAHSPQP